MNNQRGTAPERGGIVGGVAASASAVSPAAPNPFEAQQIRIAGHWRVLKKIGSGAFGDIYLGIFIKLNIFPSIRCRYCQGNQGGH
jgi:hypothetical protein